MRVVVPLLLCVIYSAMGVQGYKIPISGDEFNQQLDGRTMGARMRSQYMRDRMTSYRQQDPHQFIAEPYDARYPTADNVYKFKPLQLIKPAKAPTTPKPDVGVLTLYDYKEIWTHILIEIYRILQDRHIFKEGQLVTKIVEFLFSLLNEVQHIEKDIQSKEVVCPEHFTRVADLCLCVDFIDERLSFEATRDYCRNYKGGDTVLIRDHNDFYAITAYLRVLSPALDSQFWSSFKKTIANDDPDLRVYRQLDGTPLQDCLMLGDGETTTTDDTLDDDPRLIFSNTYQLYLESVADDATPSDIQPLCQYIPERDRDNFLYGQATAYGWFDWNDQFVIGNPDDKRRLPHPNFQKSVNSNTFRQNYFKRSLFDVNGTQKEQPAKTVEEPVRPVEPVITQAAAIAS